MVASTSTRQQPGLACEECRRRKARCDRARPTCGVCAEMGRQCIVVGTRSQRGPKKGHLKDLRSRVATLESQLNHQNRSLERDGSSSPQTSNQTTPEWDSMDDVDAEAQASSDVEMHLDSFQTQMPDSPELSDKEHHGDGGLRSANAFRMSGLQLPTPPVEVPVNPMTSMNITSDAPDPVGGELDLLYFERVHPIVPMLHKRRYLFWAGDDPSPARACLRSAMQTAAAATMSTQSPTLGDRLYSKTRRMLETQDVYGETGLPWRTESSRGQPAQIDHELIQAWLLLAHYEFVRRSERQALLTAGRAFRLLQLSRLLEIDARDDGAPADRRSKTSPAANVAEPTAADDDDDWVVTEEKRRTLWAAFVLDRLYSTLDDRPAMLHEEIIRARLPMPDADFQDGAQPVRMAFPCECESEGNNDLYGTLPPFAECVVLSSLYRRCVAHRRLAQTTTTTTTTTNNLPGGEARSQDFWTRHDWLAAATATATKTRPEARDAATRSDPLVAFNHVLAHAATVSLSDTAEATRWHTLDDHLRAVAYKQLAYQAALELVRLLKASPRIAFFKTHPFAPHAISLASNFLSAATPPLESPEAERVGGVAVLERSLRYLSNVNVSATELIQRPAMPSRTSSIEDVTSPRFETVGFSWNERDKGMGMGMGGFPFLNDAIKVVMENVL